jgi:hypothetical protein
MGYKVVLIVTKALFRVLYNSYEIPASQCGAHFFLFAENLNLTHVLKKEVQCLTPTLSSWRPLVDWCVSYRMAGPSLL